MLGPIVGDAGEKPGGKTVLVVDDDESIRETLGDVLRDEGFTVALAENGAAALRYLQSQDETDFPKVIVLDLLMPVMSGAEFRERQLDDPRLAKIPVVIMSSADRGGVIAKKMKADAFLPKPPSMRVLLETMSRLC